MKCFVIIGYGKKTSYATGSPRILDLDETYKLLIKPAFEQLQIECYRAIDKNLNGSIDQQMLQDIKDAEIVLADLSTLNANVMWELGVRHALKPYHTFMICEQKQMNNIPFDINHFVVHQYRHSEEGIPFTEVERFQQELKKIIETTLQKNPPQVDSPIEVFLGGQVPMTSSSARGVKSLSFADTLKQAEAAKDAENYTDALHLFEIAKEFALKNMTLRDNLAFIISRQALCTYKSKQPNELEALQQAKNILEELQPLNSLDVEVIGLSGAIHKRLYEKTEDIDFLETAIDFYERGFTIKKDYYNGINAAFMLYLKASKLKASNDEEWDDVKLHADYLRNATLKIALELEAKEKFQDSEDAIWILLTIAEAYFTKGSQTKMEEYEEKAEKVAKKINNTFAIGSYQEQKKKYQSIFSTLQSQKSL